MLVKISDILFRHNRLNGDKTAIMENNSRSVNYRELNAEVNSLSHILLENSVAKGTRVAVLLPKSIDEVKSLMAVNRSGGIFVDINPVLKLDQVKHIINDSGSAILITNNDYLENIEEILPECMQLHKIILCDKRKADRKYPVNTICLQEAADNNRDLELSYITETDIAAIIYTSGSTGKPKGVVLSNRNLIAGIESVAEYLELKSSDIILSVLPFSFDYGLNQVTSSLYLGAKCILINYLFPGDITNALEKYAVTGLALIPPLWQLLLKDRKWNHERAPDLRYITNSGGALPLSIIHDLQKRLPDTKIFLMYGLTEAFRGTYLPPEELGNRPLSMGKAIPNAEIWVLNSRGEKCRPGEIGELVQRGPHVTLGYWNDRESTEKRFRPNPFQIAGHYSNECVVYSGDWVKSDADGYLYFVSRSDEMIKSMGYRISPTEIEEVLYSMEAVEQTVVFGKKDDFLGEKIVAAVKLKNQAPSVNKDTIVKFCEKKLPPYMIPHEIIILKSFPLNPNGKLDRKKITDDLLIRSGTKGE